MTKKIVVLDYKKRKTAAIDRNEWFEKYGVYDKNGCFSKIAQGAPIIKNIDGTYYLLDVLVSICISGKEILDDYIRSMKSPADDTSRVLFIWR